MTPAPTGPEGPTLVYVYAVTGTPPGPPPDDLVAGLVGVAGRPVALLAAPGAGPVAFVVSDVPRSGWTQEALRSHFEDLRWVEATARAHHQVIDSLAARATVLPLRLATLYEDRARALQALAARGEEFAARLERLRGYTEFGVKVYVSRVPEPAAEPAQGPAPGPAGTTAGAPPVSPGKAYLRARRAQHHAHEDRYRHAQLAAERIAAVAGRYAAEQVRHPVQRGPLAAAADGENVLNDAFLVAAAEAGAFRTEVVAAAEDLPGIRVEVTGPWAPYSFAAAPASPGPTLATDGP
ncbi:GvpL/GvpF family gas vesicle protein [Streptomyces sp. WAC06614]|uniref:GvpL/GvpF family gas vesicle protein n=1 Tax=Streptomyces sp. WAC06614 TaxID=2487416 RepID=UPI000F7B6F91|nr:GvpL/GvpF family gas vesicle protein [Streptomyces sp. WAC06614]RSS78515.1 GvpL/GvpF family gas vesicle protein [Streptomyces sp. WAC06614]